MNLSFFDNKPNLDELDFKHDILNRMGKLQIDQLTNLIFCGLPTSGKTTKIYAFLASIFDKKVYDIKNVEYEEDRKTMTYKSSIYHIEINPIHLGSNERLFISSFLKLYVETRNIGLNIPKVILIKNADLLSKNSQLSLRKIIESNSCTSRFIFEVSNLSGFAQALVSRCIIIRIKMPSIDNIKLCINDLDTDVINKIIDESNKVNSTLNLKKIFGYYRYYKHTGKNFNFLYYEKFNDILNIINNKKISFVSLQKVRDIINEMYINLVSMNELLHFIFNKLCYEKSSDNNFIFKLLDLTIICDKNLKKGNKDCLHLEYYIIAIIDLIHTHM
jgi:replication factor C subunit 3/5